MKLKSLLFGSAAAVMAVTGAQAAEPLLPVAEPVDYVRVCDAFGTGFFYIPGTDTCLKIGGYVRASFGYGHDVRDDFVAEGTVIDSTGRETIVVREAFDRNDNEFQSKVRGRVNLDSRVQTDIGLVRTYTDLWITNDGGFRGANSNGINLREAFIQIANDWGTVTVGRASSFFEFWESDAFADLNFYDDDAPLSPLNLAAVTFNLGGGVSASLSLEDDNSDGDRRQNSGPNLFPVDLNQDGTADVVATGGGFGSSFAFGGGFFAPRGIHGGNQAPDAVANLRVDQAWGSAQIMGALHSIRSAAGTGVSPLRTGPGGAIVGTSLVSIDQEADDELGWAVGAGASFDIMATGIAFNIQGVYSDGAPGYATTGGPAFLSDGAVIGRFNPAAALVGGGTTCAGTACDLIGSEIDTTEAWSVKAGIGGDLAPDWVFNLQGSFARVDLPDGLGAPVATPAGQAQRFAPGPFAQQAAVFNPTTGLTAGPVISTDYDYWSAIGHIAWVPVAGFLTGFEVGYNKVEFDAGPDFHTWGVQTRVQKSF